MARIDSSTTSGARLSENNDDAPATSADGGLATAKELGHSALDATLDSLSTLTPFDKQDFYTAGSELFQRATHNDDDLQRAFMRMTSDPKKTLASMDSDDASWCLRQFTDEQRGSVAKALLTSGMTKQVDGEAVPRGAPKPPALYEVNDRQPPAVKEFLHGLNVIAARNYDDAYDRYANSESNPNTVAPYVSLQEPGSKASLEEGMSLTIARGVGDYATGTARDIEAMASVTRQARKLNVGDELQLQGGLDGAINGGSLGASLGVKVKRASDGFHVSPQLAVTVGGQLDKENRASAGITFGAEYHCATAGDVDRLTTALRKGASRTKSDQDFLDSHLSGLDLKGNDALKLSTKFGDSLKASAGLKYDSSVHVDLESRTVTVTNKFAGDASRQVSSKKGMIPENAELSSSYSRDIGAGADVTVTTKYTLPPNLSLDSLKTHPGDSLAAIAGQLDAGETSVKLHVQSAGKDATAVDVEAKTKDFKGVDVGQLLKTFAREGDEAAARKLVEQTNSTVKVDKIRTSGLDFGPKIGTSGDSLSVSLKSLRTQHDVKQVGSLNEAFAHLKG